MGIHYQLGAVTTLTLKDIAAKQDFEKDFFSFVLPEGVQLVEEKGMTRIVYNEIFKEKKNLLP